MCRGGGKKREMRGRREGVSGGGCVCHCVVSSWRPGFPFL